MPEIFKLEVYVPKTHVEEVKNALFAAGAGRIGNYDRCCWQIPGTGQFRPLDGSTPHIGQKHKTETVEEFKIELVFEGSRKTQIIEALKKSHPYETPAYQFWKIET